MTQFARTVAVSIVGALWQPVAAAPGHVSSAWSLVLDFMVQDVCVDTGGHVQIDLGPLDPDCKTHRDLMPGEMLSYHKSDWPGDEDRQRSIEGYQRSDSFPFDSPVLGTVVVQTFDFGNAEGRQFGKFDRGDGGQVVAFSRDSESIVLTEDPGRGLQLMAGPQCTTGSADAQRLLDSWLVALRPAEKAHGGHAVAQLRIITDSSCPTEFDYAYTEWHFANYRYRASLSGAVTAPLHTLVSSHFGGRSFQQADHLERFYFTRELGWTRWERWQNMKRSENPERDARASQHLRASARCHPLAATPGDAWLMIDCREWTNIAKADAAGGDQPDFWLDHLRAYSLTREIFDNSMATRERLRGDQQSH